MVEDSASGDKLYTEQVQGLVYCNLHYRNHFTVLRQRVVRRESQRTQHVKDPGSKRCSETLLDRATGTVRLAVEVSESITAFSDLTQW
jgi:hypothetical protein